MKVPLSWLHEFVDVDVEPWRLAEDLSVVGLAVDGVETLDSDVVLDIDVTTNRVDCMNVYGVAREVAVVYGLPLRPLHLGFPEAGTPASESLDVAIEAPDLCPRFCARVLDVRMGPSPKWIRDRLEAVGVRPINNVVDLTNYVLMEMGQPTHAFDLAKVPGGRLVARWCREGERVTTLDGVERTLAGRIGVVAGPDGPLGLAGIMGGASSEVSAETRTVALEAAYWEPLAIRRAAKGLGMHTEASHRFERGADGGAPPSATARIAHLLVKTGAGSPRPGLIDRVAAPQARRSAALRPSRLRVVLGVDVPEPRAGEILRALGFAQGEREGEAVRFEIPSWRGDVSREVDLIEEVGRHHGLGRIPATLPPSRAAEGLRPWQKRERALREILVGAGLSEVINYAFVSEAASATVGAERVALENPLSEEQAVLRASLVVPGLIGTLGANLRQGRRDVGVFEIGRAFAPGSPLPTEQRRLGLLMTGMARPAHWSEQARPADVFDAKGILETVAERLGAGPLRLERDGAPSFLHPGKSAWVWRGSSRLGYLGAIHPEQAETWDLRDETVVAELDLEALLMETPVPVRLQPLARFPEVTRDLSLVCDAVAAAGDVEARIRGAAGERLRSVAIVDRYEKPPVPEGKVSLTFALRFQDPERTLTGEEVQAAMDRVVGALKATGAEIRGE